MANGTGMQGYAWASAAGSIGGSVLEIMGTLTSAKMAKIQAERKRVYDQFNEQQAEKRAGAAIAISQRQAGEERRQASHEASRALAVAAASGGGVSDPTILRLISNIKGEGAYRASVALYEGEAQARQMRLSGFVSGFDDSDVTQAGYRTAAAATALRTGLGLYARYGMGGPDADTPARGDSALVTDPRIMP